MWSRRAATSRRVAALLGIALAWGGAGVGAHPHAFVVYSIVLPLSPEGVDRVGFVFTFDPMFSAVILHTAGGPKAGSTHHERSLRQVPFEIEIAFNGSPVALDAPTALRVSTAEGQVTYRFVVPLRDRLRPPGTIDISVDDPGMFAAFALRAAAPVEIEASGPHRTSCHRALTPTGAPGPVRCEYLDPGQIADMGL
jgi:ABC-type uncharacterized transport system substrate-binding protein